MVLSTIVGLLTATTIATTAPIIPPTLTPIIVQEVEAEQSVELTSVQEEWLAKLEKCESSGSTTVRILDTNGKYSTGRYQFQDLTFLSYGKKFGLIATTTEEATPLIFDGELQKQIAHKMLLEGGEGHWFNCSKKLGTYPK